ncbi:MAG: tRNA (guanosine(37)-N1)-methyltransferase TrmD [Candidatus Nealsonbacteria bacterium CG_4_10_14_0_8_um_filter_35_10]|uniref:tRNA (guanine-N(1)-)-methyltransferase n=2 Tax=Candidatus Nealsoniibacteriota TaxID=1817911 RepID=A0A2M7R8Y7_9BACT|nr:MAG: tRNA (guanosine(37)-N1)-methyltransferase TrmD [Parcubacteria group bacterium CG1_02_36_42]PIY91058.1 MAG: tRNA (guanosine(37)-N1)-methyltransferase TrmD [Candidatus Nealsonbacteria bacterium CG_4_10_14_0_8_um_filter_35_10]PJB99443.1 MAG: tRNA (guanosine(37)-N1)-methyltransferase TrmD [Candidatus Nealsonbacteria bacterium CG_4_9_14_0_8_um_filter_35_12]
MQFDIITIFPKIFDSYLKESFIKKAQENGLIKIRIHNLRDFTTDKHKTVDDRPYGGGLGMVLKVEPIFKAIETIKRKNRKTKKQKVILFTPRGKKFNQRMAYKLSKLDRIITICGRYEGVDERVAKYIADMELSIGDYDLMGGELPAMVVIETIARLIPGVLGKPELLKERITKEKGFIEYPQYTRPPKFYPKGKFRRARPEVWKVPKVLLSGHHKKIEEWRKKHQKVIEK